MTRGRTNPLGVPVRAPSEGEQSRRTRMATLQAFQAVAEPIVARVNGLESRLEGLSQQLADHNKFVRDNEWTKANQRVADHQELVAAKVRIDRLEERADDVSERHGAVAADTKERAKVVDARRWDVVLRVLGPVLTAIGGLIAGKLLL